MTTEDNIEVLDTEIIEPEPPRGIDDLLSLDTYQGMTDEEIDIVIDYKCKYAVADAMKTSIAKVESDARNASDAIIGTMMDRLIESNDMLLDRMSDRKYHSLEPLTVNATTLELEVSESG